MTNLIENAANNSILTNKTTICWNWMENMSFSPFRQKVKFNNLEIILDLVFVPQKYQNVSYPV